MSYLYPTVIKPYVDRHRGGGGGDNGCLSLMLVFIGLVVGFLFCIVCVINGWVLVICQ